MRNKIKQKLQRNKQFKFVNFLLKKGKKQKAESLLKKSFKVMQKKNLKNTSLLIKSALLNSAPILNVKHLKSRRSQKKQVLIPIFLNKMERVLFSMKSIIRNCQTLSQNAPTYDKLKTELLQSSLEQSKTVKTKKTIHKSAYSNYTTAHYRWF